MDLLAQIEDIATNDQTLRDSLKLLSIEDLQHEEEGLKKQLEQLYIDLKAVEEDPKMAEYFERLLDGIPIQNLIKFDRRLMHEVHDVLQEKLSNQ